jgi:alpha-2-macroglobulin
MKTVSLFLLTALLMTPWSARSQSAEDLLKTADKLQAENNPKEAAAVYDKVLAGEGKPDGILLARALSGSFQAQMQLGQPAAAETALEKAVTDFPTEWRLWHRAAQLNAQLPYWGMIIDGAFQRGQNRNQGRWVSVQERDHVRRLQMHEKAMVNLPADAKADDRATVLISFMQELNPGQNWNVWRLQVLTDITQLPGIEDQTGLNQPASGWPVDADGNPVWFRVPASWEKAANDGERWRWLLSESSKIDAKRKAEADTLFAQTLANTLGVQTIAHLIRPSPMEEDGESETDPEVDRRGKISALHTLALDETVMQLATGPKRLTLPGEFAFLNLFKAIAENNDAPLDHRVSSLTGMATEFENRRQYPAAAAHWAKAKELTKDADQKKNFDERIRQITGSLGNLEALPAQPAGSKAKLSLVFRNGRKIFLTARPVNVAQLLKDVEAYLLTKPQEPDWQATNIQAIGNRLLEKNQEKYLGEIAQEWTSELKPAADHWDRRVDLETPLQEAGAWFIEGKMEGGNVTRQLLWIEGMVLVRNNESEAVRFYLADATTGLPVAEAGLKFFGYSEKWQDRRNNQKPTLIYSFKNHAKTTPADGVVVMTSAELHRDMRWLITASDAKGRLAFLGFENFYLNNPQWQSWQDNRIFLMTDRPVYRPDQEVKFKGWARAVGYDPDMNLNPFANAAATLRIYNPMGEKSLEKQVKLDAFGGVSDIYKLDPKATLGVYQIQLEIPNRYTGSQQFRVEEYKKPEFEVKIDSPEKPVQLGDTFEAKVSANYYFGGPVKEGKVKYKVMRSEHSNSWIPPMPWDWLYGPGYWWRATVYDWYEGSANWSRCEIPWPWFPWHNNPPELVAEGEANLEADGTFLVKVDTALAKDTHGDQDHSYAITAEVTDNSRRTIFANGSVIAARRPFEVFVWLANGWLRSGEKTTASITTRTLDGKPVAASGPLRIFAVSYDKDGKPTEKEVAKFDLKTEDGTASQEFVFPAPGQYRVSALLKDEAGHEIEGSSFIVVRGENFAGDEFRFDDLELVVEKSEYAPGDEVEVLINTNRPGSRVALFVRARDGLYPAPEWIDMKGKSVTRKIKVALADQPNFFIEAYTVSNARVHQVTRQVVVPPNKRIASVEITPDKPTYLPREKSKITLLVKDQDGKPFEGRLVLTAYDKSLEYISGGSNIPDIKKFFWEWKRSHYPNISNSLKAGETYLQREGDIIMQPLGVFGHLTEDDFSMIGGAKLGGGGGRGKNREMLRKSAAMPMAAMMPAPTAEAAMVADAAPMDAFVAYGAADKAGGAPAGAVPPDQGPAPMIRKDFADTALWVADVKVDADGNAQLDFDMPDNLTTWKLRGWVIGPDSQVGEADVEVITRKNLLVRLQAPRFFTEKDEVVLSANVNNDFDKPQMVRAVLELEGGVLMPLDGVALEQSSEVPAKGEKRFDWRVKVTGEGEAKVRVKALAAADSDAMEMTFPAYVHGMLKTDSWSLALRPEDNAKTIKMRVPADLRPEQTRLEIRYSPTLALAMVDALPYLNDYPYGCTEQTVNRFVPTVLTQKLLQDFNLDLRAIRDKRVNLNAQEIGDPAARAKQRWDSKYRDAVFDVDVVADMAQTGLERLENMRNADGGWGWFPGGRESNIHITALVLDALYQAAQAGLVIDNNLTTPGVTMLKAHEARELLRLKLPKGDKDRKETPDNLDAYVHNVLVAYDRGEAEMRTKLYDNRALLSRLNQALLGLTCHALKEIERRDMLLRNLSQFLKEDNENQTAWLELPQGGWWWYWFEDEMETQAAYLRLLSAADPKGNLAPRVAKYLLNNRRNGTYWNSTRDTAAVIGALATFAKASGENEPNLTLEIFIDGKKHKAVEINKDNLFTYDASLVLEGAVLEPGEHTVEIRKQGNSPLYANAYLTVFSKEDRIPAAGLEVKVRRAFFKLIEEKPDQIVAGQKGQAVTQKGFQYRREEIKDGAELKSGDLVEVELTIESKNDYEYIILEDRKPAGFEPVEVQSGWSWEGLHAYKEYRDEKVAFFAERLPRGTHNLSYRVKAEIPGRFSALPAKAEGMYAPELVGNSDEFKIGIID